MSPLRASGSSSSVNLDTAYSLALLSEYTHTLDSLPLDLSRNFADLRELDAVLSSSMAGITSKITALTEMIENGTGQKEERLWLLTEIAEEATRLKPGGEDKIRVACQAADNLKGHANHLRALAENIPEFDASTLNRQTTYPHVAQKSFMPLTSFESGRRRRGGYGSLLTSATDPSPAKRKRVARDDDLGAPRREKVSETNSRQRNGARAKKTDRAPSPSESVITVASHMPPQQLQNAGSSSRGPSQHGSRAGNGNHASSASNKRSRSSAQQRGGSPMNNDRFTDVYDQRHSNQSNSNSTNSRREAFNVPPSSSHPSLPLPYHANGTNGYAQASVVGPLTGVANDWNSSRNQLEGPGMPVARPFAIIPEASGAVNGSVSSANAVDAADGEGDGEGEGDDKPYCYCGRSSFGQMIGCDDPSCRFEWFHISCIGMVVPPDGTWYCDDCQNQRDQKKNARRAGRGGKRKAAGNRSGGRSASGA